MISWQVGVPGLFGDRPLCFKQRRSAGTHVFSLLVAVGNVGVRIEHDAQDYPLLRPPPITSQASCVNQEGSEADSPLLSPPTPNRRTDLSLRK